jgi:hypothetical protein
MASLVVQAVVLVQAIRLPRREIRLVTRAVSVVKATMVATATLVQRPPTRRLVLLVVVAVRVLREWMARRVRVVPVVPVWLGTVGHQPQRFTLVVAVEPPTRRAM